MPQQQHKKVKLYTCMPDQTLQVSMSAIEPEWPGFLSDKVGAGRKYLTRGGEQEAWFTARIASLIG